MLIDDELLGRRWAREQATLGLARDAGPAGFAAGGLASVAVPPTVRIVVIPGDPSLVTVPAQDPQTVIPPVITLPGSVQLPAMGKVRGADSGYVGYRDPGEGQPWPWFVSVRWNGGVDFFLGELGGRAEARGVRRLIWLRRTVGCAWGAFGLQQKMIRRFGITGPFRVIVAVADTAGAALGDLGTGWAEHGGPSSPDAPASVDRQVLLHEDLPDWPDQAGAEELALRFGARLDIAFGGPGGRHLDQSGPDAGRFRPPTY